MIYGNLSVTGEKKSDYFLFLQKKNLNKRYGRVEREEKTKREKKKRAKVLRVNEKKDLALKMAFSHIKSNQD